MEHQRSNMSNKDKNVYAVVINHEEQYSVLEPGKTLPRGWKYEGTRGSKQQCLNQTKKLAARSGR